MPSQAVWADKRIADQHRRLAQIQNCIEPVRPLTDKRKLEHTDGIRLRVGHLLASIIAVLPPGSRHRRASERAFGMLCSMFTNTIARSVASAKGMRCPSATICIPLGSVLTL